MQVQQMLVGEEDSRVVKLRQRMDEFYSSITNYSDFAEPNFKPQFWKPVREAVERCLRRQAMCRVLEFGAGQTGFAQFVKDLREQIIFHVQDVTTVNVDYLSGQADQVHISDIQGINERYDVVFSTFTWEHISNPRAALRHLMTLLSPGGVLIIASPRYDFPLYLSPSVRHLSIQQRVA